MPSKRRIRNVALVATVIGAAVAASHATPPQTGPAMVEPDSIKWQALPANWADGPPPPGFSFGHSEVAIIEGDPTRDGLPFVIRIRSTPGTQLPPHWHQVDEHITVLSGVFCVGMGDHLDPRGCRDMPAASYIVLPKGMHHFAVAKGDVVQVHGVGPFTIHWVR